MDPELLNKPLQCTGTHICLRCNGTGKVGERYPRPCPNHMETQPCKWPHHIYKIVNQAFTHEYYSVYYWRSDIDDYRLWEVVKNPRDCRLIANCQLRVVDMGVPTGD